MFSPIHTIFRVISFEVRMGSIKFGSPQLSLRSTNFFAHENYNSNTLNNDVALIRLPQSIQFDENIQAIALPSDDTSETFEGIKGTFFVKFLSLNGFCLCY